MKRWHMHENDGYYLVENDAGPTLGIARREHLLEVDGYAFKDLNGNGTLEPYEDWRLPMEARIADLAARLSTAQIAGLMLYSRHQMISLQQNPMTAAMRKGHAQAEETRTHAWELTDEQMAFLRDDGVRHVLVAMVDDGVAAARWNNTAQAFAEAIDFGIPINISSDPRHGPSVSAEFNMGAGRYISTWPENLGLAATFSPDLALEFGHVASAEYRAMGIATALSPQVDIATDPRWNRFSGTFGECPELSADMARAYCDGFQGSGENGSWGSESVNAMVKHWPGGGSGEGGRDAHFGYGKYGVFPGNNLAQHMQPFLQGAFKLNGATQKATAVMPYYTISYGQDKQHGENVGNAYSKYLITDLLREKYGYDAVVCTDWMITGDTTAMDSFFTGKCWGVESSSVAERHYKALMAGVDQFGGNNEAGPILQAYAMGVAQLGEAAMRARFETSARRLLKNIFQTGLFENPYVDIDHARQTVGCAEYVHKGYQAQQRSVVLLKNQNQLLPLKAGARVWIPKKHEDAHTNWFGIPMPARDYDPLPAELAGQHFQPTDMPDDADCAFVFINSPTSQPYADGQYLPLTLQYRPYTAANARKESIAGQRSYRGRSNTAENQADLDYLLAAKKAMGDKPVVVFLTMANPTVVAEFEPYAAAIVADFSVEQSVLMDIVSGRFEPSGLLPFQMPADMETVESQLEDVPFDMRPYIDACGHAYDFCFGMNWSGPIDDKRVRKYRAFKPAGQ